jgi:hypothetical protein
MMLGGLDKEEVLLFLDGDMMHSDGVGKICAQFRSGCILL